MLELIDSGSDELGASRFDDPLLDVTAVDLQSGADVIVGDGLVCGGLSQIEKCHHACFLQALRSSDAQGLHELILANCIQLERQRWLDEGRGE